MVVPFRNEPFTDFSKENEVKGYEAALQQVEQELGQEYPLIIAGEAIYGKAWITSYNPSQKDQAVGRVTKADREHAEQAIQGASQAFKQWRRVPAEHRARYLLKAATLLRQRKHYFSAWLTYEAGKSWAEADADTAEAIDFLEYYGQEMIRINRPVELVHIPGEDNQQTYIPLGVGVIIPPWNFPLAIMVGITVSAIVTGNTVVLKPASATPVIAAKFVELMKEVGLPDGVLNFLPGSGSEVGDFLVDHPLTRFVSFTGSRDVGVRIYERIAKVQPGQIWLKRYIAEMGGKDFIIVDHDADLDWAARNIVTSSFGFSGQKCSACSRAIVHQDVYEEVLAKVTQITEQLQVGDVRQQETYMGPVIDQAAMNKILEYIAIGKEEAQLVTGGNALELNGFFVQPTIFRDAAPTSRIMQEEIFGPVVAFTPFSDLDEAFAIANGTEYGLTGSLFTRNRESIERAREELHVGNLYFNRKCTGALVGVHPFGGFNMSGTDSKAGGPDYLYQFLQAKLTSEAF